MALGNISIDTYKKIIPSCLVENILQLACESVIDVVPVRGMAGELDTIHVERSGNHRLRPGAVTFNKVKKNEKIHGMEACPYSAAEHDRYHSYHITRMGFRVYQALLFIKDLSRSELLQYCVNLKERNYEDLSSIATWALTDGELAYFNNLDCVKKSEFLQDAEIFCEALESDKVTDLGIVTFIDMAKNKEKWKFFAFDPENLIVKYKRHFEIAKDLLPYLRQNDSKYNIILFRMYLELGKDHLKASLNFLNKHGEKVSENLVFKRNNLTQFIGLIDTHLKKEKDISVRFSEFSLISLLCKLGEIKCKIHSNFSISKQHSFFSDVFVLMLHAGDYRFIKDNVLKPIYTKIIEPMLKDNADLDCKTLKSCISQLAKFIQHHQSNRTGALLKAIPKLESVRKNMDELINRNTNDFGMKGGFLLSGFGS
jgi:hypothetical protein